MRCGLVGALPPTHLGFDVVDHAGRQPTKNRASLNRFVMERVKTVLFHKAPSLLIAAERSNFDVNIP